MKMQRIVLSAYFSEKRKIIGGKFLIATIFFSLFSALALAQENVNKSMKKGNIGGYMITKVEKVNESFNAGYSMYAAAWPLIKEYPGRSFQSGLFGTWMHPSNTHSWSHQST